MPSARSVPRVLLLGLALLALTAAAVVVHATAASVELHVGATLHSPSGAQYLIGDELSYSPRLVAARHARDAMATARGDGASLLQLNNAKHAAGHNGKKAGAPADWAVSKHELGKGGFGTVYRGTRVGSNPPQHVAIKVQTTHSPSGLHAMRAEFAMQQTLHGLCPATIVRAYEQWDTHTPAAKATLRHPKPTPATYTHYMVLELMSDDLDHFVSLVNTKKKKAGTLIPRGDVSAIVPLWRQVIGGVACLHTHGYVHRDLKGPNFLVTVDGTVKVSDFGSVMTEQQRKAAKSHPRAHYTPALVPPTAKALLDKSVARPDLDQYKKWDGFAVGVTLLTTYYGTAFHVLPWWTHTPLDTYWATACASDSAVRAALHALTVRFKMHAHMPPSMAQLVVQLLREQPDPTTHVAGPQGVDLTASPFGAGHWTQQPLPTKSKSKGTLWQRTKRTLSTKTPDWTPTVQWVHGGAAPPSRASVSITNSDSNTNTNSGGSSRRSGSDSVALVSDSDSDRRPTKQVLHT